MPVQVREVTMFERLVDECPFRELDLVAEGTRVMMTFLAELPSQEAIEKLMMYVKEPERLVYHDKHIYLHCPNGYGKTKLSNTFIEKKLGVSTTTRNWKSVVRLFELG